LKGVDFDLILKKLVVGSYIVNTYIFGSTNTKEVVIFDPGAEGEKIINTIEKLEAKPIAVLVTHGHMDHVGAAAVVSNYYDIPIMFHESRYNSGRYSTGKANRGLKEGDTINVGEYTLHVLETPGHSLDSLCYYTKDPKEFNGQKIDGIIFTGDLIFCRGIGRSDFGGGDSNQLFSSIKNKIMYNPEITDNFLIFSGHSYSGDVTSVGEERIENPYREYFL
jgi:glyoxylase-like metal-dependent hydrolase (beta-lactamase superfamily II)